ncbi:motility associated factor glycosyltransferase family protein [Paenibacillus sp. EC2-1]|uniref:motility associated factor glycosyltransferase family protein n=1 Tax=Paenibacillus sp. EC2-1 TaxID=3388665 RepID=UPI003BEF273A
MINIQNNIDVLTKKFPHVRAKLLSMQSNLELTKSRKYEELVEKDAAWLQAVNSSIGNYKLVFVYGFGRGASIADLLEQYPDRWFFIYEPDEEVFYEAVSKYDISFLFDHPSFHWLSIGEEQLNTLFYILCNYMESDVAFVALREHLESRIDQLNEIKQKFLKYRKTFLENKITENRFREDWTRNYLFNISNALKTPSIEQLYNTFEDATAVIVSSGPSLDEDIEFLKKLQPHILIIAAGSSIQALINHNIRPHLAVIADGDPINMKIFSDAEAVKCPLLFSTTSYYGVADTNTSEKIHGVLSSDFVSQYFLDINRDSIYLVPSATVSGIAIQAAACMGAKKIILAGQDLSFPKRRFYSNGVNHFSNEIINSEINAYDDKVINVSGDYNLTSQSMLIMKSNIETLISWFPEIKFINTSRYGAVIEGAPFRSIEEIYDELLSGNIAPNAVSDWVLNNPSVRDPDRILHIKEKMESTLSDILSMHSEIKVLQKHMSRLRELSRIKPAKAQKELELIEEKWGAIADRDWFATIMESIIPLQIAKFDQLLPIIITEQNLISKTDLIYDHLGQLLMNIDDTIPSLQKMFVEAIHRMNQLEVLQ